MPSKESPGCRVLIVEDEATIARNCVTFFELQGYTVDIAHDGAAAIARLTSDTFDVVVLDLGLPRIDGKRVLDHLRRQLALATPVLVLTARDELDTKTILPSPSRWPSSKRELQRCIGVRQVRLLPM